MNDLTAALEDEALDLLEVIGFRGSTKTTWGSLIFPIYLALEKPADYPFIIPIADTGLQAGINIANIKNELENNKLLLQDYASRVHKSKVPDTTPEPTLESDEEWQAKNMLLDNGVRILARSRGQKIRGLKHRQFRPRAVIIDDPEDVQYVRFKENRDESERWLRGEVLPAVDSGKRKVLLIGNWLHEDALMARMKKQKIFNVIEFPLINSAGDCLWPARYPTQEALDKKKIELGEVAWQREMLLRVVPEEGQEIRPEDIHYYDETPAEAEAKAKASVPQPPQHPNLVKIVRRESTVDALGNVKRYAVLGRAGHGVDLAISKEATADFTSVVSGDVWNIPDNEGKFTSKIYVRPNPLNKRLKFFDTIDALKSINDQGGVNTFFVEKVGYQQAAIEALEREFLDVIPMKPQTDKRARLRVVAAIIRGGKVLFPRTGCEELINQLLNFGVESHDDLVDALVYLLLGIVQEGLGLGWAVRM